MKSDEQAPVTIESLDELIVALTIGDRKDFGHVIRTMHVPTSVFEDYCSWSEECYTRNCIVENEKFELILLCWGEGQITPIHNHGGEECWVKVIEGEFKETIYQMDEVGELKAVRSAISTSNDITYMIDFMGFHSLENLSSKRSMSLHLYAKPIRSCKIFDQDSRRFVNKDLMYDSVPQLVGT